MSKQLISLVFITILAGASVGVIVVRFDPFAIDEGIKILFFTSLFTFLWGLGTVAFFIINLGASDRWVDSFRRGLFLSLVFLLLIFFKRRDILAWYLGAILGGVFVVLEIWIYKKLKNKGHAEPQENSY